MFIINGIVVICILGLFGCVVYDYIDALNEIKRDYQVDTKTVIRNLRLYKGHWVIPTDKEEWVL